MWLAFVLAHDPRSIIEDFCCAYSVAARWFSGAKPCVFCCTSIRPPSPRQSVTMSSRVLRPRKARVNRQDLTNESGKKRKVAAAAAAASAAAAAAAVPPTFGVFEKQGRRDYMEDRVLTAAPMQEGSAYHFFGVYDGHGGAEASQYCKERMVQTFVAQSDVSDRRNVANALRSCYAQVRVRNVALSASLKSKLTVTTLLSVDCLGDVAFVGGCRVLHNRQGFGRRH